jgi:hypothetical protein
MRYEYSLILVYFRDFVINLHHPAGDDPAIDLSFAVFNCWRVGES